MRVAVLQFPGSNCDQDALFALRGPVGVEADYLWHDADSLDGFDAVFVPGGFSYGDYLRCGAMASRSKVMARVVEKANAGMPVIGVCNGFQILCEAGLLPGALLQNADQKFVCESVDLEVVNQSSPWTSVAPKSIRLPIAHGEGRYVADEATLDLLESQNRVAFRYQNNPNGSMRNIAGILNEAGNVLGLMPHPERAASTLLGSTDGLFVLDGLKALALA